MSAAVARSVRAAAKADEASRIRGVPVPACFPAAGDVRVLCVGEAPGPRGADKSGVPFFGDRAGAPLYRALEAAGACSLPATAWSLAWDGAVFAAAGLRPVLHGLALGNAFDRCPTDDGRRFRAPTRAELTSPENEARLVADLDHASSRGLVLIVPLGRVATQVIERLLATHGATRWPAVRCAPVVHPSAQGLLSMAPDRGRGARLADLAAQWEAALVTLIAPVLSPGASRA